jgi:hypothetical protein
MIIDNMTIPPPGSLLEHSNKVEFGIVLSVFQYHTKAKGKCLRTRIPETKDARVQFIPNLMQIPASRNWNGSPDEKLEVQLLKNFEKNEKVIKKSQKIDFFESEYVAIVGAGAVISDDLLILRNMRKQFTIITLGRAQRDYIDGDYYMGMDPYQWHMGNLSGAKNLNETVAYLSSDVWPEVATLNWNQVVWWGSRYGFDLKIPMYHAGANVTFAALQFAAKTLKAKYIFLFGIEHPITINGGKMGLTYYEAKIHVEAACWWIGQYDILIFNCTPNTTVTNGVVLCSFPDALKFIETRKKVSTAV